MITISKNNSDRPTILYSRGPRRGQDKLTEETNALIQEYLNHKALYDNNSKKFKFNSDLYAHEEIKKKLKQLQHDKCCFCEAKLTHIAYGDVEHFRPKAAYKQKETDKYTYPGYFWLAYEWDNLFFSCQICNQRHKKNLFPLVDPTTRISDSSDNISTEKPLFLHPVHDNPEEHIIFQEEIPKAISLRGTATIKSLGLDRLKLNEDRREHVKSFLDMLNIIELYPDIPEMKPHHDRAKEYLKTRIYDKMKPEAEYSSMYKALYKKRIKSKIEN